VRDVCCVWVRVCGCGFVSLCFFFLGWLFLSDESPRVCAEVIPVKPVLMFLVPGSSCQITNWEQEEGGGGCLFADMKP
jgi:hypothetical protein